MRSNTANPSLYPHEIPSTGDRCKLCDNCILHCFSKIIQKRKNSRFLIKLHGLTKTFLVF